jgi:formate hydrogenlyase transcriptional activator
LTTKDDPVDRKEYDERLRFEMLLADLSAQFVNVPADQVDAAIEDAQRRVCELLGLDLSALWQWSADAPGVLTPTHYYSAQEVSQPLERMNEEQFPWCRQQMLAGRIVIFSSLEELPAEAACDRESCRQFGVKSNLTIPLSVGGGPIIGIWGLNTLRAERDWPEEMVRRLQLIGGVFANALARKRMDSELHQSLEEVRQLRDQLHIENVYLREQLRRDDGQECIVGDSEPIRRMLSRAKQVAPADSAVLITGETGTGKELLAQAIHDMSHRSARAMVNVNCAALPAPLIESELFGREKGAYTGAMTKQIGRFELANGSTLFLDEIGDLPPDLQSKLLRVLQDGRFERLGSPRTLAVDVRVIAASNHNLAAMVRSGEFREDLFHRLNVFPIEVPPLRSRVADIPLLVWRFVQEFNKKMGKSIDSIPRQVMDQLKHYPWPGNVRELRNQIERAMIVCEGRSLKIELPAVDSNPQSLPLTMEEVERKHICDVLERVHWRIRGKQGAAEILGVIPTTLHSRMKKLGIFRPNSR